MNNSFQRFISFAFHGDFRNNKITLNLTKRLKTPYKLAN